LTSPRQPSLADTHLKNPPHHIPLLSIPAHTSPLLVSIILIPLQQFLLTQQSISNAPLEEGEEVILRGEHLDTKTDSNRESEIKENRRSKRQFNEPKQYKANMC
jgi:hypothetical protein